MTERSPGSAIVQGCSCDRFDAVDCTSCRLCENLCPPGLDLARIVVTSRRILGPETSHQDLFASLATLEAQGADGPLGEWHATRPGVETGPDIVYFPGTAALLDVYFRRDAEYAAGPHAGLLLLNAAGVRPTVIGGGSGHDLFYQGLLEEFEALGRCLVPRLGEALDRSSGETVVCASAEDAHALRDLHGVDAVHISEFLQGRELDLPGTPGGEGQRPKVAFFDPCRLGRYRGEYNAPRELLAHVADVVDMGHTRGEEPCCGVSAWVNCNAWSKAHREDILRRAREAGAEVLVTACPMCQVHLDCYYAEEAYDPDDPARVPPIRVADLAEIVAELGGLRPPGAERLEPPAPWTMAADAGVLRPVGMRSLEEHLGPDAVSAAHLCTLCLRCVQECPQDAPVVEHVMRVRQALSGRGLSPPAVAAMVESIREEGNPFGEPRDRRTEAFPASLEARVATSDDSGRHGPEVLLFLGCVMSYQDPRGVGAVTKVLDATGIAYSVLGTDEACCGYMAHLAGAEEEFRRMAALRAEQFRGTGARLLVTPCPGCLKSFLQLYPEAVPDWPGDVEVLHLTEFLDRLSGKGTLRLSGGRGGLTLAYHDPCDLGRHCGVYDAPRQVLASLPGVKVVEFPDNRETAMCCGGGGGLRAFDNEVSLDIGERRLESLPEGVDVVVSACPSCKGNLRLSATRLARKGGPRLRVMDVSEVVASRLGGGEEG